VHRGTRGSTQRQVRAGILPGSCDGGCGRPHCCGAAGNPTTAANRRCCGGSSRCPRCLSQCSMGTDAAACGAASSAASHASSDPASHASTDPALNKRAYATFRFHTTQYDDCRSRWIVFVTNQFWETHRGSGGKSSYGPDSFSGTSHTAINTRDATTNKSSSLGCAILDF